MPFPYFLGCGWDDKEFVYCIYKSWFLIKSSIRYCKAINVIMYHGLLANVNIGKIVMMARIGHEFDDNNENGSSGVKDRNWAKRQIP